MRRAKGGQGRHRGLRLKCVEETIWRREYGGGRAGYLPRLRRSTHMCWDRSRCVSLCVTGRTPCPSPFTRACLPIYAHPTPPWPRSPPRRWPGP
eukprot:213637-Chlamydomonas_euryale.AAC.1